MRLYVQLHTEDVVLPAAKLLVLLLVTYGITCFTHPAFWYEKHAYVAGSVLVWLVVLRFIAHGPSARHLPDNASAPSDFKQRPLNARPYAGKVAVLTGGTSGIGFETLKSLCFLGAHVVIVDMVDEKAAEAAQKKVLAGDKHASMTYVKLNLSRLDDISSAAWEVVKAACSMRKMALPTKRMAAHPCIDFLINNAGMGAQADMSRSFTADGFELTFCVNYFGPYVLTEWLLPYVADKTARIVNLASCAHGWFDMPPSSLNTQTRLLRMLDDINDPATVWCPAIWPYALSKFSNLVHACSLAKRLEKRGVTTASVHPGAVFSHIWRFIPYPLKYVTDFMMTLFFKDCYMGHQTTLHCITAGNIISGQFYADAHAFRPRDEARDEKNWQAVEEWTREKVKKWLPAA